MLRIFIRIRIRILHIVQSADTHYTRSLFRRYAKLTHTHTHAHTHRRYHQKDAGPNAHPKLRLVLFSVRTDGK